MNLSWMTLLAWLLGYIALRRRLLSEVLGKSVNSFMASNSTGWGKKSTRPPRGQSDTLSDIAGEAPFWLAPIHQSTTIDTVRLKKALGWDDQAYRRGILISIAVNFAFLVAASRIVYLSFLYTDENHSMSVP